MKWFLPNAHEFWKSTKKRFLIRYISYTLALHVCQRRAAPTSAFTLNTLVCCCWSPVNALQTRKPPTMCFSLKVFLFTLLLRCMRFGSFAHVSNAQRVAIHLLVSVVTGFGKPLCFSLCVSVSLFSPSLVRRTCGHRISLVNHLQQDGPLLTSHMTKLSAPDNLRFSQIVHKQINEHTYVYIHFWAYNLCVRIGRHGLRLMTTTNKAFWGVGWAELWTDRECDQRR